MVDPCSDATAMFTRLCAGDDRAADDLLVLVYGELRQLASRYLHGERPGHTLQTTALVHEAYLRLIDQRRVHTADRVHFMALAAQAMRRVLVDHARGLRSEKRGHGMPRVPLDDAVSLFESRSTDLTALDEALDELSRVNDRQGRIVELRFFGGMNQEQTAKALGVSKRTVERDWRHARAWLYQRLGDGTGAQ